MPLIVMVSVYGEEVTVPPIVIGLTIPIVMAPAVDEENVVTAGACTSITVPLAIELTLARWRLLIAARRGKDEYGTSQDIEDIIKLLDGRPELPIEIQDADEVIREFLSNWCRERLADTRFLEAITWNLPGDKASQEREEIILNRMTAITKMS